MSRITVIEASWLQQHLQDDDLVLLDVRQYSDYAHAHLPGARHLDPAQLVLNRTDETAVTQFITRLVSIFSELGISKTSQVVVYSEQADAASARAAWALDFLGHAHIAVLNGGLAAAAQMPKTADEPSFAAADFQVNLRRDAFASAEQIRAWLQAGAVRIIDARDAADYQGEKSNAKRSGRIPGATHWDVTQEQGAAAKLAEPSELAARFIRIGVAPEQKLVVYCGGGGRAARTYIALGLAGYRNVSVYPASWNEWGNREDLPIESPRSARP